MTDTMRNTGLADVAEIRDLKVRFATDGEPALWGDRIAEGVLGRVVRVQLSKGPRVKGHETYRVRIENASPFVLAGLAIGSLEFGKAPAVPTTVVEEMPREVMAAAVAVGTLVAVTTSTGSVRP